jgi:hypothetical protein
MNALVRTVIAIINEEHSPNLPSTFPMLTFSAFIFIAILLACFVSRSLAAEGAQA